MTLSFTEAAQNGSRFNLWVTIGDCSKVICYGPWTELIELVQPVLYSVNDSIRAVHVLPDGEEPTFTPPGLFTDDDEDSDE